jgi:hypothetical protein
VKATNIFGTSEEHSITLDVTEKPVIPSSLTPAHTKAGNTGFLAYTGTPGQALSVLAVMLLGLALVVGWRVLRRNS